MFNLRRFLALFRPDLYTPFELALRDIAQRRYEDGLARLDTLLADPATPTADVPAMHNKRGVALVNLRRPQEARAAFDAALAAQPRYAPALVNVGNLMLEAGEAAEAIRWYERAMLSDDEYAPAHHNLAVAYKRLGRTGDAVRALRRATCLEGRVVKKPRK